MPKALLCLIALLFLIAAVLFPAVAAAGDDFAWEGPSFYGPGLDNRSNDNRRALAAVMWDDGNGPALYVGGNFRTAGGVEVNHIARWDGTEWTSVGGGMTGDVLANSAVPGVYALAMYEGDLIAAGNFTLAGGVPANHIARWDGEEWSPLGSGMGGGAPGEPPLVRDLTVYDGDLIAGGDFPQAGGATVNFVARWDGGEWSALTGGSGTGVDGPVATLSEFDGDLIVGGAYTMAGGMPANNIARWDGNDWSSLTSGVGGAPFGNFVNGLATFEGDLIVGGGFAQAGGVPANNVARWDGSAWSALGSGMDSNIQDLVVYDGGVVAGGLFTTAGGLPANGIARWDGSSWSAVGLGVSGLGLFNFVTDLMAADGELFALGQFHEMDGVTTNSIARWDGSVWSALGEPMGAWLNGPVTAATVYDGALIVAGTFSHAGDVAVNGIARREGDGWAPLGAGVDAAISAFAIYAGDLIAAGSFTVAGGQPIAGVARWDGESWSALGDGVSNGVNLVRLRALAVYDGDLIVGGQMTEAGGVPVNRIARWDGEAWSALGSGVDGGGIPVVNALAIHDGALVAGGSFTDAGGLAANHIAAWDGEAWSPLGEGMTENGRVEALAVYGGELIAAGSYIEDGFLKQVVRWDGETWTPLDPDVIGAFVSTLTVVGDDLFAAGNFDQAGGVALNNVARWDGSTWSPLAGPAGPGTDAVVRALTAFDPDGAGPEPEKLVAGGSFVLTGGVVNWYLGFYGPQELLPPTLAFDPPSLDFGEIPVGVTSPPQTTTLHNSGDAEATGLTFGLPGEGFDADTGACGTTLPAGEACAVVVTFTPAEAGPATATLEVTGDQEVAASLDLAGEGVETGDGFTPAALAADPTALDSDGNGVFEPGERVAVAPAWRNDGLDAASLQGSASAFTGPEGGTYTLVHDTADYGVLQPGQVASCLETEVCYEMEVDSPAVRPAPLWVATFDEVPSEGATKTWSLHLGDSFADVPRASPFYASIETLLHYGVTGGCAPSGLSTGAGRESSTLFDTTVHPGRDGARPLQAGQAQYCPGGSNSRGQMAVFLLRAVEGSAYQPPACVEGDERFGDVPFDSPFCPWIEELSERNVTSGCGGGDYCPGDAVSRAQMAVFLLKALEGDGYTPPECTGEFSDVECSSVFAAWIEELAARGITGGCAAEPPAYCPATPVTRAQMAVFVTRTFGLTLYGP